MTHADMDELYELYALGALESGQAAEIGNHLNDQCEHCMTRMQQAVVSTAMLAALEDAVEPPPGVRQRLLASFGADTPKRRWNWMVPAFATACAALLVLSVWGWVSAWQTRSELARVAGERAQLREALQVLSASQPTLVQFGRSAQEPRGTVFFNRNGGFVVLGSRLPEIASDKAFELWVVPKKGAPMPAGTFQSAGDTRGFVHAYQEPINVADVAAIAVSIEPKAGSLAPTTKPFLIVPIGS